MSSELAAGDFVWVKTLRMPWWPAVLVRPEDCPLKSVSQKSLAWCVKYLGEDQKYECITKPQNIKPFHCSEMDDYIKKGSNLAKQRPSDLKLKVIFDKALKIIARRSQIDLSDVDIATSEAYLPRKEPVEGDTKLHNYEPSNTKPTQNKESLPTPDHIRNDMEYTNYEDTAQIQNLKATKANLRYRSLSLSPGKKKKTHQKFYTPQNSNKKRKKLECSEDLTEDNSKNISICSNNTADFAKKEYTNKRQMKTILQNTANTSKKCRTPMKLIFSKHRHANKSKSVSENISVGDVSTKNSFSKNDDTTLKELQGANLSENSDALPLIQCNNHSFPVPNIFPHLSESLTYLPKTDSTELYKESKVQDLVKCDSDYDSDDSDLPEFSEEKVVEEIKRGDIVWARYGSHPFWPAVVKSYYKKQRQRKVTLVFLGPEKWQRYVFPVVYNKSSIKPFCAAFKELEGDSVGTDVHLEVKEAIEQAQDFYRRRALGEVEAETAMEYFFGKEEPTEESPDAMQFEYANEATSTISTCSESSFLKSDSEPDDEEPGIFQNTKDMPSRLVNSVQKRNDKNRKLVDFILGDSVQEYLIKVIQGEVPSKWLEEYNEDPLTRQQSRARKMAYRFGPLTDDHQIDEITDYLKKLEAEHHSKGEPVDINYVLDVLFPEAIIYSLSKMRKLSKQKALEMFLKGPRRFKEESRMIRREILFSASTVE